jgi:transcription elongation factor/antiterminator RfaH
MPVESGAQENQWTLREGRHPLPVVGEAGKRWFAVHTQPRKERLALRHLNNQCFQAFCPFRRVIRRKGSGSITALEAFFPSYIFVCLDKERERWRSINGTIGVARLVGFGAQPSALPEGLIERLQLLCGPEGDLEFDEDLRKGERVRIAGGPFDALCGVMISAAPKRRVSILLELLSGPRRVRLNQNCLARA